MSKLKTAFNKLQQPLRVSLVLMVLCGLVFPLVLNGLSAVLFPSQANGSLVEVDGKVVGAAHVGQEFTQPYFMKGRPSAVHYNTYTEDSNGEQVFSDGTPFTGPASGSNNYGPSNPALKERVEAEIEAFLKDHPGVSREDLPADLMTASGSGLDPHISPASAKIQIPYIAQASGLTETELNEIVENNTNGKLFGIFGEETVSVLGVNIQIAERMALKK